MQKTRFILAGGHMSQADDGGASFYRELIARYDPGVKVLVCAFARDIDTWPAILQHEIEQFKRHAPEALVQVNLASILDFKSQIETTDVLIFRGGNTEKLLKELEGISGWHDDFGQKTIAGSSAGAYILAEKYMLLSNKPEMRKGLGLVDGLVVAHYRSSSYPHKNTPASNDAYWNEVDRLIDKTEYKKAFRLREGEYTVIDSPKT